MIIEYIRYALKNHTPKEFIAAYIEGGYHLRAAPECLSYELSRCSEDDHVFILRIQWVSVEAHLQQFRGGPYFPPFLSAIGKFIPEIAEMRHYEVVLGGVGEYKVAT